MPAELRARLPALYSQEYNKDPVVHIKFFSPDTDWTWYATEGAAQEDGDFIFFGFPSGFEEEWGNSSLKELQSAGGRMRLPTERDLYFSPAPFTEVLARHRKLRGLA